MKISGKNNSIENQRINNSKPHKSNIACEEKDIANSPNPAEYIGRSQVVFKGKTNTDSNCTKSDINTIDPLKLVETSRLSKSDVEKYLKELYFTKEDIDAVKNDENLIICTGNLNAYLNSGIIDKESVLKDSDFKEFITSMSTDDKKNWLTENFSQNCKYANKENLEKLRPYITIEDDGDLNTFITNLNDIDTPELLIEKIPLIAYAQGKLNVSDIKQYKYLDDKYFQAITPERVEIIKKINSYLPKDAKLSLAQCSHFGDGSQITPELIDDYCNQLEEFSNYNIINKSSLNYDYAGHSLPEMNDRLHKINETLTKYPIDLQSNTSDYLDIQTLYNITQRDDIETVQKYINSLSDDARAKGISNMPESDSDFPMDKMAEICNLVFDKDYGKINEEKLFSFIKKESENNYDNIDGIIQLLETYKGSGKLDTYYPESVLFVGNRDYKGAADAIKIKDEMESKGISFGEYIFDDVISDNNSDFKEFNKILTYIKDNKIDYRDYPMKIYKDKHGANKLELRHFLNSKYYWLSNDQLKTLDNIAENIQNEEEMQFVKKAFFEKDYNGLVYNLEDIQKLHQAYQTQTNEIKYIFNLRSKEGYLKYKKPDNVLPLAESLCIDKDYTQFVMQMKDCSRGMQRFYSGADIKFIVEAAQTDKGYVNELLSTKVKYDKDGNQTVYIDNNLLEKLNNDELPDTKKEESTTFKYEAEKIAELVKLHTINPELTEDITKNYDLYFRIEDCEYILNFANKDPKLVKRLVNDKTETWNGEHKQRFNNLSNIRKMLESLPDDTQFVDNVLNSKLKRSYAEREEYKYNDVDILHLFGAANIDRALTEDLMNEVYDNPEYNRFNPQEIEELVNCAKIDKPTFKRLLDTRYKHSTPPSPLYSAISIKTIMNSVQKDKQLVNQLLDMNDNCPNGEIYSVSDIVSIVNTHNKNPQYTDYLLSLKTKTDDGVEYPIIAGYSIEGIVNAHEIDADYTKELINLREKDSDGKERLFYSGSSILNLVLQDSDIKEFSKDIINHVIPTKNGYTNRFHGDNVATISQLAMKNLDFAKYIINDKTVQPNGEEEYTYDENEIVDLLKAVNDENKDYLKELSQIKCTKETRKGLKNTTKHNVAQMIDIVNTTTFDQYNDLKSKIGEKINNYTYDDVITAIKFINMYQCNSLNEIPLTVKKEFLRHLVASNANLFNTGENLKLDFPMIPQNQEEYCSLMPAIVRSLGIETNPLTDKQINKFNNSLNNISQTLSNLSDKEFTQLKITQDYTKEEFIIDVLDKVKDLSPKERQKVYDYYGFELKENPKNKKTGFSIIGYPVNLNNGVKLAEITDKNTKQVVESLRENVIKFSENNKVISNNKDVENLLNDIVKVLPEIRTMIGKEQHGAHHFDIMKHSLKVMQKIAQDEKFDTLDDSDRKVVLLATLLHDITKAENISDSTHPKESSYDTFFITKKFKLSKDEEIKLYTLIKNHEWLSYVNTAKNELERTKRQQSVAFDLQQNNLFDLSLIFTHADLRAVKVDDSFHDKREGDSRIDYNGEIRSFGESADFHAEKIREYVKELQKSQPILPVTKMPKASDIEKVITHVNKDGSTNIKGVYKDKDGLVIVKFNEVDDDGWEAMGLPKGSSTKGIIAKCSPKDGEDYDIETGNIKFFVHGLEYANQLAKFDAFSMCDSDALLSVSYAERPETKYRFFRPQGVILDVPTEYIHGGGETDSGSGYRKDIQNFKDRYIFGGERDRDRLYVSNLVKEATGMNDDEYVEFVQKNKDKSMMELEPENIRELLIKKFATINSNTRRGERGYNEMYISNPRSVMGVFAYNMNIGENINDPIKFMDEIDDRTKFLKEYAKSHDIPFYVFGD